MTKQPNTLQSILSALYIDAYRRPGELISTRLGHGLSVGMRLEGSKLTLFISRPDVPPSQTEWETVMNHCHRSPAPDARPAPKPAATQKAKYLYATWTLPEEPQWTPQQFLP